MESTCKFVVGATMTRPVPETDVLHFGATRPEWVEIHSSCRRLYFDQLRLPMDCSRIQVPFRASPISVRQDPSSVPAVPWRWNWRREDRGYARPLPVDTVRPTIVFVVLSEKRTWRGFKNRRPPNQRKTMPSVDESKRAEFTKTE